MTKVFRVTITHIQLGWLAEGQVLTYQVSEEGEPDMMVQVKLHDEFLRALELMDATAALESFLDMPVGGLPN